MVTSCRKGSGGMGRETRREDVGRIDAEHEPFSRPSRRIRGAWIVGLVSYLCYFVFVLIGFCYFLGFCVVAFCALVGDVSHKKHVLRSYLR